MNKNMHARRLLLVTRSFSSQKALSDQLREVLPEDVQIIPVYANKSVTFPFSDEDFMVFSGRESYDRFINLNPEARTEEYLIGTRTLRSDRLEKLFSLPQGEQILFAAESKSGAEDSIRFLHRIGFDFLDLASYYPDCDVFYTPDTPVITTGKLSLLPPDIKSVCNIGIRPFDFATVISVMTHYNMSEKTIRAYAQQHLEEAIQLGRHICTAAGHQDFKEQKSPLRIEDAPEATRGFGDIIGNSPAILQVKEIAAKIASSDLTVLIEGDSGTGKHLFARAIHNQSARKEFPFISINLSALSDQAVEAELFGSEENGKVGLFQQADGGTIFLSEIGELSLQMQAKILRVLREREIMRVDGLRAISVNVRIIAGSGQNLEELTRQHMFRRDLYYRLKETYIYLPPLSQRKEDIPLLIDYWLKTQFHTSRQITRQAINMLTEQAWPGNIRELHNIIQFMLTVSDKRLITAEDLPYNAAAIPDRQIAEPSVRTDDVSLQVLAAIHEINQRSEIAGRNRIYWYLREQGCELSEYKIRKVISQLSDQGIISARHGKYGLSLTDKGIMILEMQERNGG